MIDNLITKAKTYNSRLDEDLVRRAFQLADAAHVGQKRKDGSSYIHHPLAVAYHLVNVKVDAITVAAALLHDTLQKTEITKQDLIEEFGETTAELVNGVATLKQFRTKTGEEKYQENIRKLILAASQDVRVVLIRLAEKLHNLETLEVLEPEMQRLALKKVYDIYAPLADRLGVSYFKWRLEDLAFQHLKPSIYEAIEEYFEKKQEERENYINTLSREIKSIIENNHIDAKVSGRVKHHYSIYQKFLIKQKPSEDLRIYLERLHDKLAFRILVDSVEDCYLVLDLVHQNWKHDEKEFYDYIAIPKPNGYRSIHTILYFSSNKRIEVQIRTHKMHEHNEFGPAAHLFYKEIGREKGSKEMAPPEKITWLKGLVKWQEEILQEKESQGNLKLEVFQDRVFIFTPKGDLKDLPKGVTPIDFAYSVHSDIGDRMVGAKVNDKLVSLEYELKHGDVCEILVSKKPKTPSSDWLYLAKTRFAKNRIRRRLFREGKQR